MTNMRVAADGYQPGATGFQIPARHLIIGGTLFGVGSALCIAGIAISGSGILSAVQRWIGDLERAPADIAKDTFAAARAAATAGATAGARAWQEQTAAQQQAQQQRVPAQRRAAQRQAAQPTGA